MNQLFIDKAFSKLLALVASLTLLTFYVSDATAQEIDGSLVSLLEKDWAVPSVFAGDCSSVVECGDVCDQQVLTKNACPKRDEVVCVSARDDVWFVNARQSHLCPENVSQIQCYRLRNGVWESSSLTALTQDHASDKSRVTFVYAHGNRTDEDWAKSRGLQVYKTVFRPTEPTVEVCVRPALRYVIFAWKSEQEKLRILPDYTVKSRRSPVVGQSFGRFLSQFEDRKMVLCGFSLGAQVILAGLSDSELDAAEIGSADLNRYKVALLAPALDPDFVWNCLPQIQHNMLIERTEVFVSLTDRAIKLAEKLASKTPRAWVAVFQELGQSSHDSANPVSLFDVTEDAGKRHLTESYASSSCVISRLNKMVAEVQHFMGSSRDNADGSDRVESQTLTPSAGNLEAVEE